jgi:hemin uptake protein HemP
MDDLREEIARVRRAESVADRLIASQVNPDAPPNTMRVRIVRRVDEHQRKPPIADVIDRHAHVEIEHHGRRYSIDATVDGKLELRSHDCQMVIEPLAGNTVRIHGTDWSASR